jgi:hypothetical protein
MSLKLTLRFWNQLTAKNQTNRRVPIAAAILATRACCQKVASHQRLKKVLSENCVIELNGLETRSQASRESV